VFVPERLATALLASIALEMAQLAIAVAFPVLVTGHVRLAFVVTVAAFQVMFVWSPVFVPLVFPITTN